MLTLDLGPLTLPVRSLLLLLAFAVAWGCGWWVGRRRAADPEPALFAMLLDGLLLTRLAFVAHYAAEVARFLAAQGLSDRDVLLDGASRLGQLAGSRALPTTLFYGADGQLRHSHLGELSTASLKHALEFVRTAPPSDANP